MPYYILHAGTALQKMSSAGVVSTLVLPTGITLVSTRPARFAILNKLIFVANAPSKNLIIDGAYNARLATPTAPSTAPTTAAGTGGLTGLYIAAYTYAIKSDGRIIAESDLSPIAAAVQLTGQGLAYSAIGVSTDPGVNCRRLYRSSSGGSSLYLAHDIDDNSTTTYTSAESDAALGTTDVAEQGLGSPPGATTADRLKLVVEWKDRLWGVSNLEPDNMRYSGSRMPWAWDPDNMLPVNPVGIDLIGVNGFLPRRDELGFGKIDVLWKIIGSSPDDFRMIKVVEGTGVLSPDSCLVIRDVGYFQSHDGVYEWGPEGVASITDDNVRPWFTTDDYFNRTMFPQSFARYNKRNHSYELHLAAAGSTTLDRWIQFDIRRKRWFGPHKTLACTPSCGGQFQDDDGLLFAVIGGTDGFVYEQNRDSFMDGDYEIEFDVLTQPYTENVPDLHKVFLELSLINKAHGEGWVEITPTIDNDTQTMFIAPIEKNRTRLRRLGAGRLLSLRFQNSGFEEACEIYGFEVPFNVLGRR